MVYDNYNLFVIGYGPSDEPSHAIFSIAARAKGVSLCFLPGAGLPDPNKLLRGSGRAVPQPSGVRLKVDESKCNAPLVAILLGQDHLICAALLFRSPLS